ncbi:MAG: hypothetical protein IT290_06755, partial [Deltaproteobacteria bacterium]|nr:hypothetical protein [Deltaproteobacteria bacterium]
FVCGYKQDELLALGDDLRGRFARPTGDTDDLSARDDELIEVDERGDEVTLPRPVPKSPLQTSPLNVPRPASGDLNKALDSIRPGAGGAAGLPAQRDLYLQRLQSEQGMTPDPNLVGTDPTGFAAPPPFDARMRSDEPLARDPSVIVPNDEEPVELDEEEEDIVEDEGLDDVEADDEFVEDDELDVSDEDLVDEEENA